MELKIQWGSAQKRYTLVTVKVNGNGKNVALVGSFLDGWEARNILILSSAAKRIAVFQVIGC